MSEEKKIHIQEIDDVTYIPPVSNYKYYLAKKIPTSLSYLAEDIDDLNLENDTAVKAFNIKSPYKIISDGVANYLVIIEGDYEYQITVPMYEFAINSSINKNEIVSNYLHTCTLRQDNITGAIEEYHIPLSYAVLLTDSDDNKLTFSLHCKIEDLELLGFHGMKFMLRFTYGDHINANYDDPDTLEKLDEYIQKFSLAYEFTLGPYNRIHYDLYKLVCKLITDYIADFGSNAVEELYDQFKDPNPNSNSITVNKFVDSLTSHLNTNIDGKNREPENELTEEDIKHL